jgi:SPP1 gp7 family putative phage head morphogenesis protein
MIFAPLPHTEARDRIATLPLLTRDVFDGLLPELKAHAFTVSGITAMDTLVRVRDEIAAVPQGGATWAEAKKRIAADLEDRLGPKEADVRAELLLRTHTFRSYAVSRYRSLMAQRDAFPYWMYQTHGDERVRPSHKALDGKIFSAGHPIWQRIFPPWDWGCRCLIVPMTGPGTQRLKDKEQGASVAPEDLRVYDGGLADAIHKAERLPNGIALQRAQTWSDSPWGVTGKITDTWVQIQERYAHDPAVIKTFGKWALKTEIEPGYTIADWLGIKGKRVMPKVVKAKLPKATKAKAKVPVVAARDAAAVAKDVLALAAKRQAVVDEVKAASDKAVLSLTDINQQAAAITAIAKAKVKLDTVLEAARVAAQVATEARGAVRITRLPNDVAVAQVARDGAKIVERYTHKDLLPEVSILGTNKERSEYSPLTKVITLRKTADASVAAHEITHGVELQAPGLLQRSLDFLRKRAGGKAAIKLRSAKYPKYGKDEVAFEDEWEKKGGNLYTGRDYKGVATELLTMGIQRLHEDPILFAITDPEYFAFVISTLHKL